MPIAFKDLRLKLHLAAGIVRALRAIGGGVGKPAAYTDYLGSERWKKISAEASPATTLLVAYWGFRFGVLGVYVSGRTREKLSAATGQDAPGAIEKLVKAVVKKK
jgi:hypothetical protein